MGRSLEEETMTSSQLSKLQAENQVLSEELAQCQADKEFVWSLWKRLQVASPDVTQAISLVVQREKEKAELKDRKILEILQIKDDRIAELERLLSQKQDDFKNFVSRKIEMDEDKKDKRSENKYLREQQQQMEELLQSKEVRMKNIEDIHQEKVERLENEKEESEKQVTRLTLDLEKARKEVLKYEAVNVDYKTRIKDLEKDVQKISETAERVVNEEDGNLKKLKESKGVVLEIRAELMKKNKEMMEHLQEETKLRNELRDVQTAHTQAVEHTTHQGDVIQQLQTLQMDTQKVLKNQEDAHKVETSSFQAMYQELQTRYKASKSTEQQLRQRLIAAQEQMSQRKATRDSSTQVNIGTGGKPFSKREEWFEETTERERNELDERYRPLSSTPVRGQQVKRSRSLSPRRPQRFKADVPSNTDRDHLEVTPSEDVDKRDQDVNARKIADLRKLLKLKNAEVEEMRSTHSKRLERLKALQASYNVLKEQIKTYDAQERNPPKKKKKSRRSEPRTLQKEDSDGVWNELAYFKQQTVNVLQERMNLHEELDCLRVQTKSDATTIKELTGCLEQERQELEEHLSQLKEVSRREKHERAQVSELQSRIRDLESSIQRLDREKIQIARDKNRLETDNRSLRMDVAKQRAVEAQRESKMMELKTSVSQLKKKLIHLRHRQRHSVGAMSWRRNKTPKEHQSLLNRSIQEMSSIFPGFDSDGWEETQSDQGPRDSTSLESLGHQIVQTSRTDETLDTPRRRALRTSLMSPSTRQLESIRNHLQRMAQAYDDKPVRDVILKSVATQTERVLEASMIDASVGEYLISDDVSTVSSSTMTDEPTTDTDYRDVGTSPLAFQPKSALYSNRRSNSSGTNGPSLTSLKQRVISLQKQVSLLKETKSSLQRTVTEQSEVTEQLQSDLNLANQRLKISKQTIQRLSVELEQSNQQRAVFEKQLTDGELDSKKQSESERKQTDSRLKAQSGEIAKQGTVIKYLKNDVESRDDTIKSLQEKVSRQDRDINQKRSLIEDLRLKARAVDTDNRLATRATELLEEKILNLTETNDKKRTEVDSIRKQLSTVTKEKRQYEQLYMKVKMELDRKGKLLQEANVNLTEAETISTELEITAGQQMKKLAHQTEVALGAAHEKLKRAQTHGAELQGFIKTLASKLLSQTQDARQHLKHSHKSPRRNTESLNGSLSRAQGIASSILNMSASDLDEFMASSEEDMQIEDQKEITDRKKDEQWSRQVQTLLSSKVPSSEKLLVLFLGKLEERDRLLGGVDPAST
ncbi:centlein-like isoform X2 [Asterias amurensis]|uniref:centlein-like isoform X2 n=1 Tax=Asterias amurensis TaxID=7602 RepID=UPI003AB3BFF5